MYCLLAVLRCINTHRKDNEQAVLNYTWPWQQHSNTSERSVQTELRRRRKAGDLMWIDEGRRVEKQNERGKRGNKIRGSED